MKRMRSSASPPVPPRAGAQPADAGAQSVRVAESAGADAVGGDRTSVVGAQVGSLHPADAQRVAHQGVVQPDRAENLVGVAFARGEEAVGVADVRIFRRTPQLRGRKPASPFEIFQPVVFRGGGVVAEEEVDADAFAAAERVDRYGEEPAVARRSAPHGGVMRFAERADEAAGGVAVGAEVAERRSGAAVGRQVPFVDEGRGVRGVTGFVEMPQAGQTACGRICAGDAEHGGDAKQQRRKESVHGSS